MQKIRAKFSKSSKCMLFKAFYFKDKVKTDFWLSTQRALEAEPTLQANSAETLQLELANPLK